MKLDIEMLATSALMVDVVITLAYVGAVSLHLAHFSFLVAYALGAVLVVTLAYLWGRHPGRPSIR